MESNVLVDIIKVIIIAAFGGGIAAIIPAILQARKEKEDKGKIRAETGSIGADAAQKIVMAASELQDTYKDLLQEMRVRTADYKTEIDKLSAQTKELEKVNMELKLKIEQSGLIIAELMRGVRLLSKQLEKLNVEPVFSTEDMRSTENTKR